MSLVQVYSDIKVAFLYFDIHHLPSEQLSYRKYRISPASLGEENAGYHPGESNIKV